MNLAAVAAIEQKLSKCDAAGARDAAGAVLAESVLSVPERIVLLKLRARAHETLRDLRAAIADLEEALALAPHDSRACNELGILFVDAGESEHAIATFKRATTIDPKYARGWNNYGSALRAAGRTDAAAKAFGQAVAAAPNYAFAWANLGATLRELGDDVAAESALARALSLDASQWVAVYAFAGLRREQGRLDEAAMLYREAARLDPRDANAPLMLGGTLSERDDLTGAAHAFDAALARDPCMLRAALGRHLTLPMLPLSVASIESARSDYRAGLNTLANELPARASTLAADRALDELRWSNFLLAYQGDDDIKLQEQFGAIVHEVIVARAPKWLDSPSRRTRGESRARVGFLSAFFRDSTVGRYFEHWITDLPREQFEVVVYHLYPTIDVVSAKVRERADTFQHCPRHQPSRLAPQIRRDALDLLVFPEVGMDATTFALASLRLAPKQCVGWGHPVTTGLKTIDAFFSCAAMEPPGASRHYTEPLVRLPGIGTLYEMPAVPDTFDRARFGLPDGAPLFLCPQSLFKMHPDDDALFARVLAASRTSHLVVFEGRHPAITAKYRARLATACADAGVDLDPRIHVLPPCAHDDYLRINRCCTAMLDTTRWSGGNTSLDALACSLPIVTLPGRLMRARQSMAMLQLAGVCELIAHDADDYVRIASRLAADRDWADAVKDRIRGGRTRVFNDPAPIAAFADALSTLAHESPSAS